MAGTEKFTAAQAAQKIEDAIDGWNRKFTAAQAAQK